MKITNGNRRNQVMNACFDNLLQKSLESLQMETTEAHSFVTSKPIHTAPAIKSELDGVYYLENGNTILKEKYIAMWHPNRGKVKPFGFKGDNPDKTKIK